MTKISALQLTNVVARSAEGDLVVTWNGSATFNIFKSVGVSGWQYEEVECFTVYDITTDSEAAQTAREKLAEFVTV